ncbi:MAG: hypothetical protein DMG18_03180 [Acidobacteria bacterium]|nr:MAG: hypothetical protein DMG18_03180 [Acidobacteriota bacterium]
MQGTYTRAGVKGLEANPPFNPIDPGEKNPLSVSNREDGLGPYPRIFGQGGNVLRGGQQRVERRLGIVFPEDRKLPWRPDEDAKRRQFLLEMNPAKDLKHVELNSRCALPGLFEGEDGNNPYTILQPPGKVVIVYDYNHTSREIDLNRREHFGKNIRLFMGDSLGHWEGSTLVVDTTNFNGHVAYSREIPYLSEDLHTIERFTMVDENTIEYEVTIDDPKLFTGPWKVAGSFSRVAQGVESLEFACAEGSQTLQNIFGLPPATR